MTDADRHTQPPMITARCRIVEAANRVSTFQGLLLADGHYVGWTIGQDPVLLVDVYQPVDASVGPVPSVSDEGAGLWDADVLGSYHSVPAAMAEADVVFALRG